MDYYSSGSGGRGGGGDPHMPHHHHSSIAPPPPPPSSSSTSQNDPAAATRGSARTSVASHYTVGGSAGRSQYQHQQHQERRGPAPFASVEDISSVASFDAAEVTPEDINIAQGK